MFKALLQRAGMSKAKLARDLGITPNGVSRWKDNPPQYVIAYLEVIIDRNFYMEKAGR